MAPIVTAMMDHMKPPLPTPSGIFPRHFLTVYRRLQELL
jgi:hypothetical protein